MKSLLLLLLFLLISCDKSFDTTKPFSYKKGVAKINSFCKMDSDCNTEKNKMFICNTDEALCVINPCNDINCGNKGSCEIIRNSKKELIASCKCDVGYKVFLSPKDNKEELICKKTCDNPLSCKEGNHKVNCIQDEYSTITCGCSENYKQNEDAECVNPC